VALGGVYASFYIFGVYRGVWRYVGVDDLLRYLKASAGGVLMSSILLLVLHPGEYIPSIFLLFVVYLFIGLAASRSSFRVLDLASGQQNRPKEERVIILGAGDAGEMALRWILMNPQLSDRPVGFVDNDPFMIGRHIHGVEVLGSPEQLVTLLPDKQIDGLIIASPTWLIGEESARTIAICHSQHCWVRSLRLEFEVIE
jgi:FlaA1/EpsC-like NDP-sugar epimerase